MSDLFDRLAALATGEVCPTAERRRPALRLVEPEPKFTDYQVFFGVQKLIDLIGRPNAFITAQLVKAAKEEGVCSDTVAWLAEHQNRARIKFGFARAGYIRVGNPTWRQDRAWRIGGTRGPAYARKSLPPEERLAAVCALREKLRLTTV